MSITIYDSWGLEPDKEAGWQELIKEELEKHDTKDMSDWFYTIIYCIDAHRLRIDQFEHDIIEKLFSRGNRLIFALNRSDIAKPDEIAAVQEILMNKCQDFSKIPICSLC